MLFTSINLLIFYNPPCYLHIISKNYIFISLFYKYTIFVIDMYN